MHRVVVVAGWLVGAENRPFYLVVKDAPANQYSQPTLATVASVNSIDEAWALAQSLNGGQ